MSCRHTLSTHAPHSTTVGHDEDAFYGLYTVLPTCKVFFIGVVINMITGMYGLSESVKFVSLSAKYPCSGSYPAYRQGNIEICFLQLLSAGGYNFAII
jgi:hypothetical protein